MHFYGRAAAEAIFSGPIFRTFTARRDRPRADAWFRPVAEARRRVTASGSVGASPPHQECEHRAARRMREGWPTVRGRAVRRALEGRAGRMRRTSARMGAADGLDF